MNAVPVKMLSCDVIISGSAGSTSSQSLAQAAAHDQTPIQYQSGCKTYVPTLAVQA